jgi:hypothetical protein
MSATTFRPALAISGSVLTAATVFAGIAQGEATTGPADWQSGFMLLLPAALIALFLVAFFLMPLWRVHAAARSNPRLRFALVAATIWVVACGALAAHFGLDGKGAVLLILPGCALIVMFSVLVDRPLACELRRSDSPPGASIREDRAVSRSGPAPAVVRTPGNVRVGG